MMKTCCKQIINFSFLIFIIITPEFTFASDTLLISDTRGLQRLSVSCTEKGGIWANNQCYLPSSEPQPTPTAPKPQPTPEPPPTAPKPQPTPEPPPTAPELPPAPTAPEPPAPTAPIPSEPPPAAESPAPTAPEPPPVAPTAPEPPAPTAPEPPAPTAPEPPPVAPTAPEPPAPTAPEPPAPTAPEPPVSGKNTIACMYADNVTQIEKINSITPDMLPKIETFTINGFSTTCEVKLCSSDILCRIEDEIIHETNVRCESTGINLNQCPSANDCITNQKQMDSTSKSLNNSFQLKHEQIAAYKRMKNKMGDCIYANGFKGETLNGLNNSKVTQMLPKIIEFADTSQCKRTICSSRKILCNFRNGITFSVENVKCSADDDNKCPPAYACLNSALEIDKSERRVLNLSRFMSENYDAFHEVFPDKTLSPVDRSVSSKGGIPGTSSTGTTDAGSVE